MDNTSDIKHRTQTPLIPCEGFIGVYSRAGAGNGATRFHARVSLPGGAGIYVGSFPDTGQAALAYDNVVRCFVANKPEGFKYTPGMNYPGISDPPPASERANELLPKFLAAVNKRLATIKPKEVRSRNLNLKLGRPNTRPMVEFNLLTLRDCLLRLSQFQFTPPITETLHSFSAALQGLLTYHKVDVAKCTPQNPDAAAFQKRIDALVHEANVQRGLAELQGGCPKTGRYIPADAGGSVPAVPTFSDIKCPGDLT